MIAFKRILGTVAKNNKIDSDELLIALWDVPKKRFDYLKSDKSFIKNKDYRFVKDVVFKIREGNLLKYPKQQNKRKKIVIKDYDFSLIGKTIDPIEYINKEEILKMYSELTTDFNNLEDPIQPSGIKDEGLLDSAIFHPQTSFTNQIKYPTAESAAAAIMYSLSHNHAFHNGNKRTAIVAMLVFLDKHNIYLTCDEDDLFKISLTLADHKLVDDTHLYPDAEIYELARWIRDNSKTTKKGERPITLKKFKQILTHFGCDILDSGRVQRKIKSKSIMRIAKERILTSKKTIGGTLSDGQEMDKGLIKSIREDLELDTSHGIDSDTFYEKNSFTSSDFINKYSHLLRRLSKT